MLTQDMVTDAYEAAEAATALLVIQADLADILNPKITTIISHSGEERATKIKITVANFQKKKDTSKADPDDDDYDDFEKWEAEWLGVFDWGKGGGLQERVPATPGEWKL